MNDNDIYAAQNMYDAWDNGDRPAIRRRFARREELIRMTREAGGFDATPEFLERFAALVAAAEREACAKVCEDQADDGTEGEWDGCCLTLAKHIRARGQT